MTIWIKTDLLSAFMCLCVKDAIALKGHSSLIVIASKEGWLEERSRRDLLLLYTLYLFWGGTLHSLWDLSSQGLNPDLGSESIES